MCIFIYPLKTSISLKEIVVADLELAVAILELNMAFLLVSIQGLNTKQCFIKVLIPITSFCKEF